MNAELIEKLFAEAPVLYGMMRKAPAPEIDLPDDLFPFLWELSINLELFNTRYPKRYVRALKIAMNEGVLEFTVQRNVPCVQKRIQNARQEIRRYRRNLREALLERAKQMGSTALFSSMLLPDWKRTMPDEIGTIRRILEYAERFAASGEDWELLASWYRLYCGDDGAAQRCRETCRMKDWNGRNGGKNDLPMERTAIASIAIAMRNSYGGK